MKLKLFSLWLALASVAGAAVKLPAIFSDHMVLQADTAAAVWGWADPGESISVELAGEKVTAVARQDGTWSIRMAKLAAIRVPQTLKVSGKSNSISVADVLVGEVWLASGQSNMEMRIKDPSHGSVDRADEQIAAARFPEIRMFVHDDGYSIYELTVPPEKPMVDRPGKWRVCSPETVADFSAIGYFFARDLHHDLRRPIGIVLASVGGTPIEAWTPLEAQRANRKLEPVLADWEKRLTNYDPAREQATAAEAKQQWLKARAAAAKKNEPAPKAPAPFKNLAVMRPGGLYNALIAPVTPYTLRGCIWYQGERNAAGPLAPLYGEQLRTLVGDWRARWSDEFYFAWVQLPAFAKEQRLPSEPKGWGVPVRDGMLKALSLPRTGMAITMDLGGASAGHPTNKLDYARRLGQLVLHDVYARPIAAWTGPLLRSAERDGARMIVTFDHATGLKAASGELKGFAIAGEDQKFVWANAAIQNEKLVVWHESIAAPAAVRYSWAANPIGNLVNGAGLPASPFRTDDW